MTDSSRRAQLRARGRLDARVRVAAAPRSSGRARPRTPRRPSRRARSAGSAARGRLPVHAVQRRVVVALVDRVPHEVERARPRRSPSQRRAAATAPNSVCSPLASPICRPIMLWGSRGPGRRAYGNTITGSDSNSRIRVVAKRSCGVVMQRHGPAFVRLIHSPASPAPHSSCRGNDRQAHLPDARATRMLFHRCLVEVVGRAVEWSVHAYVFMSRITSHPGRYRSHRRGYRRRPSNASGRRYVSIFQLTCHERTGHALGGTIPAPVRSRPTRYLLACHRYSSSIPCAAGLVKPTAASAVWSSYRPRNAMGDPGRC